MDNIGRITVLHNIFIRRFVAKVEDRAVQLLTKHKLSQLSKSERQNQ